MGKLNCERVQKVIGKFVERLEGSTSYLADWAQDMLCGYVLVLVNKAERRGAENAQGGVMGKTNDDRAGNIVDWWVSPLGTGQNLQNRIAKALHKAERRGRRKERKAHRPCIHCPACGRLIALIPLPEMNRKPQPPFDVEKVKMWLTRLKESSYSVGVEAGEQHVVSQTYKDFQRIADNTEKNILHELGIDDD